MTTPADASTSDPGAVPVRRGLLLVLVAGQLLSGLGVASGVAIGGLLAERLTGTVAWAGFAQTSAVLGAGVWAIPLARLAARRGRRWSLTVGYLLALAGTAVILISAMLDAPVLLFAGAGCFGAATAAGLQARYAATEVASAAFRARSLSIVLWSTTLGSVVGPNLASAGSRLGRRLGIEPLAGPYLFSLVAFAAAAGILLSLLRVPPTGRGPAAPRHLGAVPALRLGWSKPATRLAIVAIACSHTVMVGVMVMTPVHMQGMGLPLSLVGIVISVHILGMYGASPLMGWLTDRISPQGVLALGVGVFAAALGLAALSGRGTSGQLGTPALLVALGLLGLGWSAGIIGGSTLLAAGTDPDLRLSVQGAGDAVMNVMAAAAAAVSGPLLGWGGYPALAGIAAVVLVPMAVLTGRALLTRRVTQFAAVKQSAR